MKGHIQRGSKARKVATSNRQKRAVLKSKSNSKALKQSLRRRAEALEIAILKGAVAADPDQQVTARSLTTKPLYYVDQAYTCKDCGKEDVWTAAQQKWYYEVAKGPVEGRAIRCLACRRQRRQGSVASRRESRTAGQ